jgi:ABC-2 type transport system ATP-binding protein
LKIYQKEWLKKIQFITTILHEPELLILDEPFSGLDPVNSQLIKDEILNLKNNNTSIILSTHNMNSVEEICDEAAIIHKSNKILQGEIFDLKERYQGKEWLIKYQGNQMSFTNAIWGGWKMLNHNSINEKTHLAEIELNDNLIINQFIKGIIEHVDIIEINKKTPTMNDVFIKATLDE